MIKLHLSTKKLYTHCISKKHIKDTHSKMILRAAAKPGVTFSSRNKRIHGKKVKLIEVVRSDSGCTTTSIPCQVACTKKYFFPETSPSSFPHKKTPCEPVIEQPTV